MIDREHELPLTRQAEALKLSRGSVYYLPRPVSPADLALMRRIDELHLDYPFAGSRMLRDLLDGEGFEVGRKHVGTLMRQMGIEALYRKPNTSRPRPGTSLPLSAAQTDGRSAEPGLGDGHHLHPDGARLRLSRRGDGLVQPRVLAWRLSINMEVDFCIEAVEEAMASHGTPEIFNTDQGIQFTSQAFTGLLTHNGIAITMDGKGAWRDNVFVERLWRSVKYEEVYLNAYDSVGQARASLGRYLAFYNRASEHPSVYVIEEKRFC